MGSVNQIEIYQAEVEKSGDCVYRVKARWKTKESAQPYQGNYHMEIIGIEGTVYSTDTTEKIGKITNASLDPQAEYTVKVSVGDVSDEVSLLLQTYENAAGTYDGSVLKLTWGAPYPGTGGGRCFIELNNGGSLSYDIPPYVYGVEIPVKEELYGQDLVLKVSLQPLAVPVSIGPVVELPGFYSPRYMVSQNADGTVQICYKNSAPDEKTVSMELDGEIYAADGQNGLKKPEAPIKAGPLELGNSAPYCLTVQTDTVLAKSDYDQFVTSVCGLVTPKAMYEILELITRCALYPVEDSLYFHCGLRPAVEDPENANQRCADVRPGFYLRLEQEMYMSKETSGGSDTSGFVGTHTAEYMVSVTQGDSMQYLEFDSFVSAMDEEIYPPQGQAEVKPVAAGIIDLCAVRMRAPFYRIQYPDGLFSSEALPDAFADNHTRLVADAGWNYVPSSGASTGAACLWFRGRSAMTLLVSVVINGIGKKVPVGTTLGKLLVSVGICGVKGNEVRWYRRSPFGKEVRICFAEEPLKDMVLLNGDRIEA